MTTVVKLSGGGFRVFSKGASEIVLKRLLLFSFIIDYYLAICSRVRRSCLITAKAAVKRVTHKTNKMSFKYSNV